MENFSIFSYLIINVWAFAVVADSVVQQATGAAVVAQAVGDEGVHRTTALQDVDAIVAVLIHETQFVALFKAVQIVHNQIQTSIL